ncbi:MAG: isochorismatase family protein [Bacteroidetes bacterium]|nr:isochorismatase family protein [Bacteroidota bacterium]
MQNILLGLNLQLDFFPGGALDLRDNSPLIGLANKLAPAFDQSLLVCDWHPANHISFAGNHLWRYPGQILEKDSQSIQLWLIHAVAESFGAEIHPKILQEQWQDTFYKGQDAGKEAFSAFSAKAKDGRNLEEVLRLNESCRLFLLGMCTEFDILETALEARQKGIETSVFRDACFPAAFTGEAEAEAWKKMEAVGVRILHSSTWNP